MFLNSMYPKTDSCLGVWHMYNGNEKCNFEAALTFLRTMEQKRFFIDKLVKRCLPMILVLNSTTNLNKYCTSF
jgi:hypothetical protein